MDKKIRDRILEAAEEIFSRFGFKKTTMDEIAESLHKAKGSIYYYFKNKEDVFKSILEKQSSLLKNEVKKAIENEFEVEKKLEAYVLAEMKMLKQLSIYCQALKDEYLSGYTFIKKLRREHFRNELETVKNILKEGVHRGVFEIKQIESTAVTVLAALKGLENEQEGMMVVKSDNLLHILCNGLRKR